MKKRSSYSAISLSLQRTMALSISKTPFASAHMHPATPSLPQFALLPQGRVLKQLFYTSLYISNISFFLSIFFFCLSGCQNTGASEESALQLSTSERDTVHAFCPGFFAGDFYGFGSKENWNWSKALLFLHVVLVDVLLVVGRKQVWPLPQRRN